MFSINLLVLAVMLLTWAKPSATCHLKTRIEERLGKEENPHCKQVRNFGQVATQGSQAHNFEKDNFKQTNKTCCSNSFCLGSFFNFFTSPFISFFCLVFPSNNFLFSQLIVLLRFSTNFKCKLIVNFITLASFVLLKLQYINMFQTVITC